MIRKFLMLCHKHSGLIVIWTFVIAALIAMFMFISHIENLEHPKPAFDEGDIVTMKAFGITGMVLHQKCTSLRDTCTYIVRFANPSTPENRAEKQIYHLNDVREYELELKDD